MRKNKLKESIEVSKKGLKSAIRLLPVLGIPWIVGVFMIIVQNTQVFCILAIVHTVLSGLQGFDMLNKKLYVYKFFLFFFRKKLCKKNVSELIEVQLSHRGNIQVVLIVYIPFGEKMINVEK